MLSLYLYLDQLDIHQKQQNRHKKERLSRAYRLTRLAVYGELLCDQTLDLSSLYAAGSSLRDRAERDRERNQEKQALWLRDKLIELGPTFIKIGQAMGTSGSLAAAFCRRTREPC